VKGREKATGGFLCGKFNVRYVHVYVFGTKKSTFVELYLLLKPKRSRATVAPELR